MTATLTAGTSSVAVRVPHLLCLAVAVLLHVAVLALLPADNRLTAPPAPPISVSLIAPPPQPAAYPAAMAAARKPALAKSPQRPPLAEKAPAPQTRLQPTPKPRTQAPQAPGERGEPRAAEPAAPGADVPAPARAAEPAPAPRDEPAPAFKAQPAPAGAEPARRADAAADAGSKLPSGAAEAPEQQAQVTPARVEAAYLDNPIEYPRLARRLGEQGTVLLDVHVGADGLPRQIVLKASSGSPRLDQAARETVQRWKFVPARQGGRAVDSWLTVPIRFVLQG
jgi:protein TonB